MHFFGFWTNLHIIHDVTLESLAIFTLCESKSLRKYHYYSMDKTKYFTNMNYVFSFISRTFPYIETITSVGKFNQAVKLPVRLLWLAPLRVLSKGPANNLTTSSSLPSSFSDDRPTTSPQYDPMFMNRVFATNVSLANCHYVFNFVLTTHWDNKISHQVPQ